jgi:Tol biopolymer transport system component
MRGPALLALFHTFVAASGCGRLGYAEQDAAPADAPDAAPCRGAFGAPAPILGVNSPAAEYGPVVSADGLEIVFYSDRPGGPGDSDIWRATRARTTDPFDAPVPLENVSTTWSEGGPSLTGDGLTLFFSSNRPGGDGDDVWMATRPSRSAPFGPATHVPELGSPAREYDPIVSRDGLSIYVSSERAGGMGRFDIWLATRASTSAAFGAPLPLSVLGSPGDDNGGSETADRLTIVFSRDDGTDIDVWSASRTDPNGDLAAPVRVDEVRSSASDFGPSISPDGDVLYFSSSRPGGEGRHDLWFATRTCP